MESSILRCGDNVKSNLTPPPPPPLKSQNFSALGSQIARFLHVGFYCMYSID